MRPAAGVARAAPRAASAERAAVVRLGPPQTQEWPDGDWVVRQVPGAAATKTYRCPGCDQEIRPGAAHVVVWPAQTPGPDERGTGTIRAGSAGRAARARAARTRR